MTFVAELTPHGLFHHFDQLLAIPRRSKHEEQARRYVLQVAERNALTHRSDDAGNIVVEKPASPGREGGTTTVLQAHLDMVTVKNSAVDHDFDRDPIVPRRDGDWLYATGTSLGADNGIGVAAMLALAADSSAVHGPLELLFTVDEETGLNGAKALDGGLITGRQLLNLDSEGEAVITVGCAGAGASQLRWRGTRSATPWDSERLEVLLRGLRGGHSGVDIHLGRGNAIQLLARALYAAAGQRGCLASFAGGESHNAIPREAMASLTVPTDQRDDTRRRLENELTALATELATTEPNLDWEIRSTSGSKLVLDPGASRQVLALLVALPHGVIAMSPDLRDLVETSTNLSAATLSGETMEISLSSRSSVDTALAALRRRVRAIAELAGAALEEPVGYPGWKPDLASPLLAIVQEVARRVYGLEPRVEAIHAGLECGLIGAKVPGMDMVSIGPTIENPHSPDERVAIPTVGRFDRYLREILAAL